MRGKREKEKVQASARAPENGPPSCKIGFTILSPCRTEIDAPILSVHKLYMHYDVVSDK